MDGSAILKLTNVNKPENFYTGTIETKNRTFYTSNNTNMDPPFSIGTWDLGQAEQENDIAGAQTWLADIWIIKFFLDCSGGVGNMFENGDEIALSWVLNGLEGPTGMTGLTGMTGWTGIAGADAANTLRWKYNNTIQWPQKE